jgi:hypothetical protein
MSDKQFYSKTMSKIYHFKGNDSDMKVMSKKTYQTLQKVKASSKKRVSTDIPTDIIQKLQGIVRGGYKMSNQELLVAYLKQSLRIK